MNQRNDWPIMLIVGLGPTMQLTGNGGWGFDSGEGAWEMATTSKEGSRRVNYSVPKQEKEAR